jgi:deazaflavin-dependent oxidoreductase (nitroreductase family)
MSIVVPPRGTRGSEFPSLALPLMRAMTWLFHHAYRRFGSRMRVQGRPLLELETIGARSGASRRTMLGWFPDTPAPNTQESARSWIVVASGGGSARHPAWFLNLARNPDKVWITVGQRRAKVTPETLEGAERERAWRQIIALAPGYARYSQNTDRVIPIIRLREHP